MPPALNLTFNLPEVINIVTFPHNFQTIPSKTGDGSIQSYQVEVVILIEHQTLATNLQGNV